MTNHIHIVVQTPLPNLARGMQRLHGHYGRHFNRRHDGSGHVFEKRYRPTLIETETHLQAAVTYVGNNPVDAGLCTRPEDWRRSSASMIPERYIELTAIA
jgi:REP element-mobilizing transposase RayT